MVIQGINLGLKIRVIIEKGRVTVSSTFKFLSHRDDLFFSDSNLRFKVMDCISDLDVLHTFLIDSPLKVIVLLSVSLIKVLLMFQFLLVRSLLCLELKDFILGFKESGFFALKVIAFLVNDPGKVIDTGQ
jgi:hypothetical protein